jgi:hypothetical protein
VKSGEIAIMSPPEAEYFEAVSRAASDRGRRARREEILLHLISHVDANLAIGAPAVTQEMLVAGNP